MLIESEILGSRYWMVTLNGTVCWIVPDLAITVTEDVTGFGAGLPPHPISRLVPNEATAATTNSSCIARRFLHPKQQNAIASVAPGIRGEL